MREYFTLALTYPFCFLAVVSYAGYSVPAGGTNGMILKIAYYIIVLFTRSAVLFYTNIPGFFKSFGGYDCGIFAVACIMRVFKYPFYGVFRPYGFIFKIYDLFFCQTVSDCRQTFAGQVFIEYSFNRFRFRLIYKGLKSSFFVTE